MSTEYRLARRLAIAGAGIAAAAVLTRCAPGIQNHEGDIKAEDPASSFRDDQRMKSVRFGRIPVSIAPTPVSIAPTPTPTRR